MLQATTTSPSSSTTTTTFTSTTTSLTSSSDSSALSEEQQWTALSAAFADDLEDISLSEFRLLKEQELDQFLQKVSNTGKKARFRKLHSAH
jgi:hypothetical protein